MKRQTVLRFCAGFAMMFFLGVFYAWSLFRAELEGIFPQWSAAGVSLNFTLFITMFCLGSLAAGRLSGKWGPQNTARLGAIFILAGGLLFSFLGRMEAQPALALGILYVSYGGLCGAGVGMAYNADISAIGALFPKAGGTASGLLLTGIGFGTLLLGALVIRLASVCGFFPAFLVSVIAVFLVVFLGAGALKPQASVPATKSPECSQEALPSAEREFTSRQMLRTPVFWLYFFWVICMTSGGLMVINSAAEIAAAFGAAAVLGMLVSVFNGLSRLGIGGFCDRFGSRASMAVSNAASVLAGLFLLLASFSGEAALMFPGLILAGITYGCAMSLNAAVIRERFGNRHYASNFSFITLSGIPASLAGPYISGLLQDAFGGYRSTFWAMIVFSLLAAALLGIFLAVTRNRKKAG